MTSPTRLISSLAVLALSASLSLAGVINGGGSGGGGGAPSGPAGGDLTGTYPNPQVVSASSAAGLTVTYGLSASSAAIKNGLTASSGTFTATGATQYSVATSSGISVAAGGVTAPFFSGTFYGNGAALSGVGFSGGTVANETDFLSTVTFHEDVQPAGSTVTFSVSQSVNWQLQGPRVTLVLTGNVTSSSFTNALQRGIYVLTLVQGGSGSNTFVWPTNIVWPNQGIAPTLSTAVNARDYFVMMFDTDNNFHILAEALNN